MKNYIKPEFTLASLGVTALASSNCSIQKDDRDLILGILAEYGYDIEQAFMSGDGCQQQVDGIVTGYCKFSSGSNNPTQIFFS